MLDATPHTSPHGRTTLRGDDVIFMYPAADPATYAAYGCTVLAWGGASSGKTVRAMQAIGVHSTGSLWCLTAGAENLHKDADLRDAVCRDIEGKAIPVWWLFDNTFEGTPTWFGCTNHPAFRAFVRERVAQEMRGGAPGLHVDDHLGTAHTVAFLGGCFCDYCMSAFRSWLGKNRPTERLAAAGVTTLADFDYRSIVRGYATDDATYQAGKESIPLYWDFLDCQLQLAAENVRQLGALASEIVGHPITLSANTALPELPHLAVAPLLTHLVGEVPHHADKGATDLLDAVHAYRMAEAIGKPLAATARGADWAWVKARGAVNLVKIWIALGYCMGQRLMAPHRQWCFTLEKGSHWYEGPAEAFAPFYQFVRSNSRLFANTQTLGPLISPKEIPGKFDTAEQRLALQSALIDGDAKPMRTRGAWIFPRRAEDGSLVVHLLNLDYAADGDRIAPQRDLSIQIPWKETMNGTATIHSPDADPVTIVVTHARGTLSFTVRELRVWAVVSVG